MNAERYMVVVHDRDGKFVGYAENFNSHSIALSLDRNRVKLVPYFTASAVAANVAKRYPGWIGTAIPSTHQPKAPIQCR